MEGGWRWGLLFSVKEHTVCTMGWSKDGCIWSQVVIVENRSLQIYPIKRITFLRAQFLPVLCIVYEVHALTTSWRGIDSAEASPKLVISLES